MKGGPWPSAPYFKLRQGGGPTFVTSILYYVEDLIHCTIIVHDIFGSAPCTCVNCCAAV